MLPKLRVRAFTENGELRGEVAEVLTASEPQLNSLNTTLPRLLAEYRALEVSNAERIDESLPGLEGGDQKVTVRFKPMPEEGARLKQRFEAALQSELGGQRADLVMKLSQGWLYEQFNRFGNEPKTISVSRHPNGTYDIHIESGNGSSFVGSTAKIYDDYIPAHLRPLFSDVLSPTDSADPTGPPEN
jgi:hypothetical protein